MKQHFLIQYLITYKQVFFLILLFMIVLTLSNPARQKAASSEHKKSSNVPKETIRQTLTDSGPSLVSVNGRQLIVQKRNPNGTLEPPLPYTIKGVNWSPASQNTNTSTTDPNNANVRRPEFGIWASTDIPLMKNMNVNTVRMFIDPGIDANGRAVLDQLYSNGIMVIMTVDDAVNNTARVQQAVNFYKDHPAILMWMLGNEWNINNYYGAASSTLDAAQRTQNAAALVKSLDSNHPVATSYGEIDINGGLPVTQGFVNQTCPAVDVWALNIYRGNTFGTLFEQWRAISSKPMFIGEFGTDAFRSFNTGITPPGVVDEISQSQWVLSLWNDLFKNLSAPNPSKTAIGGCVFSFSEEWWKVQPSGSQQTGGFFSSNGHPDSFANEEYFGIVDINRQPRLLYQTLTTAFAANYQPAYSITYRALSRGLTAQEFPFQNGVCRFFKNGVMIHQITGGAGGGRGFNIAIINPCTGELKQPIQNFDTYITRNTGTTMIALTNLLNSVSNGDMVLIAVADESGLNQFPPNECVSLGHPWIEPFYQAIEALGSTRIRQYCYNNSWALSAIKGNPQTAQEQLMNANEANASLALPIQTTISPLSYFFTQNAGSSTVTVTSPSSCNWAAVSNNTDWLNIISGNSGSGNGIVSFSATAYSDYLRVGTMTIAGQPFVVTQGCSFSLNPTSQNFPAGGGTNGNFTVSTTANCGWTATSNVNWITFPTGNTGSGNGTVNYSVALNSGATQRTGTINVNGQVHTVTQSGAVGNLQVTVQTNPLGRSFSVDGTTYTSAQTFNWISGSSHTIGTVSPQTGGTGTQYIWNNWSDGGAISHSVSPTVNTSYTANFSPITAERKSFDFDGDNKTDISIFRPSSGQWWINRSSTGQTIAAQFGLSTDKPTPADFTGDGKTDVAFWRPSSGFWFILRSEDSSFYSVPFGANGDIPAPGDFDGDGKADTAVYRPSNGTWYISASSGGTTIQQFGIAEDKPVVADYDGDGKADIAVFRPSTGVWWLLRSSSGVIAAQFGAATDKPVQGDYSGDGKADIAVWRPSNGFWFILRSEDSSFYSVPFGASGDIAAPGDYDGDGKFDTAVFRPSNTNWYVQRTTAGTLIQQFGTTGDLPLPASFVP